MSGFDDPMAQGVGDVEALHSRFPLFGSEDFRDRRKDLDAGKAGMQGAFSGQETAIVSPSRRAALSSTFKHLEDAHPSLGDP